MNLHLHYPFVNHVDVVFYLSIILVCPVLFEAMEQMFISCYCWSQFYQLICGPTTRCFYLVVIIASNLSNLWFFEMYVFWWCSDREWVLLILGEACSNRIEQFQLRLSYRYGFRGDRLWAWPSRFICEDKNVHRFFGEPFHFVLICDNKHLKLFRFALQASWISPLFWKYRARHFLASVICAFFVSQNLVTILS